MYHFKSEGGRDYLSFRSSNPNPARRFAFTVSNGFALGVDGIRDLSKWLAEQADLIEGIETPAPAPKKAAPRKAAPKKKPEAEA